MGGPRARPLEINQNTLGIPADSGSGCAPEQFHVRNIPLDAAWRSKIRHRTSPPLLPEGMLPLLPAHTAWMDGIARQVPLVRATLTRLNHGSRDVDDLTSDVLVRALAAHDAFNVGRQIRPWLVGICSNVSAEARRLRARQEAFDLLAGKYGTDTDPGPDALLERADRLNAILQATKILNTDRYAIFLMHDLQGQTVSGIAAALAIPIETAKSRLRLARTALRLETLRLLRTHRRLRSS